MTEIPRKQRIDLAVCHFGLYTFGLAMTDCERVDEDCAMDNMSVPFYFEQLTPTMKESLEKLNGKVFC